MTQGHWWVLTRGLNLSRVLYINCFNITKQLSHDDRVWNAEMGHSSCVAADRRSLPKLFIPLRFNGQVLLIRILNSQNSQSTRGVTNINLKLMLSPSFCAKTHCYNGNLKRPNI